MALRCVVCSAYREGVVASYELAEDRITIRPRPGGVPFWLDLLPRAEGGEEEAEDLFPVEQLYAADGTLTVEFSRLSDVRVLNAREEPGARRARKKARRASRSAPEAQSPPAPAVPTGNREEEGGTAGGGGPDESASPALPGGAGDQPTPGKNVSALVHSKAWVMMSATLAAFEAKENATPSKKARYGKGAFESSHVRRGRRLAAVGPLLKRLRRSQNEEQ